MYFEVHRFTSMIFHLSVVGIGFLRHQPYPFTANIELNSSWEAAARLIQGTISTALAESTSGNSHPWGEYEVLLLRTTLIRESIPKHANQSISEIMTCYLQT